MIFIIFNSIILHSTDKAETDALRNYFYEGYTKENKLGKDGLMTIALWMENIYTRFDDISSITSADYR